MAWSEGDRAKLRHYLGFAALFLQADPRLENAISSVQSRAEGGTRPDDSTEQQIRGWLSQLSSIESKLQGLWDAPDAISVDEIRVDPARGMALLRMEGRRLVASIARALSTRPRADVFSGEEPNPGGSPFPTFEDLGW